MGKVTLLVGAAAGYVLGSRAGRERYDQIVQTVTRFWENPKVQERVSEVEERASETARTKGHGLQDKARSALDTAKGKVSGGGHASGDSSVDLTSTYETTSTPPAYEAPTAPPPPYGTTDRPNL